MLIIERLTRLAFGIVFGWIVLLLAAETYWRRRRAALRRGAADRAIAAHPRLRPTVALGALEWGDGPTTSPGSIAQLPFRRDFTR